MRLTDLTDPAGDALRSLGAYASDLVSPTVRLGVTGLSRSGKTVFITALVHNLVSGGKLPFFGAVAEGRVTRAWLEPQPDDNVPRFEFERHLDTLTGDPPDWPEGTRRISQLRVTLEYEPVSLLRRLAGVRRLHLDIVDYPGEWLLDLPMLAMSYEAWSRTAIAESRSPLRTAHATAWHGFLATLDPSAPADEQLALKGSELFARYLRDCRTRSEIVSGLSPGRFLMPGDLAGSPALTFMPLDLPADAGEAAKGSLHAMMARRYLAYRKHVVKPFFRDHFARLDRQIVLVDALAALNGGRDALDDLGRSLGLLLESFRPGANSWLSSVLGRKIDRIVFAATKADHLHHTSHDRLERILGGLTQRAIERARFAGAEVKVIAIASVRSTSEGEKASGGETLPVIVGTPMPGERLGSRTFSGHEQVAAFPGDLPDDLRQAMAETRVGEEPWRFLRFRPPVVRGSAAEPRPPFPHIRLDRVLDFLVGDRLT